MVVKRIEQKIEENEGESKPKWISSLVSTLDKMTSFLNEEPPFDKEKYDFLYPPVCGLMGAVGVPIVLYCIPSIIRYYKEYEEYGPPEGSHEISNKRLYDSVGSFVVGAGLGVMFTLATYSSFLDPNQDMPSGYRFLAAIPLITNSLSYAFERRRKIKMKRRLDVT